MGGSGVGDEKNTTSKTEISNNNYKEIQNLLSFLVRDVTGVFFFLSLFLNVNYNKCTQRGSSTMNNLLFAFDD